MKNKKGKVYIIGAGPGDPGLITVKGLNILKKADSVFYDFLSNPLLLKHVRKNARKVCVGKKDGLHLKEQSEINSLLYKDARVFRHVVRLKGGDPFVFSRGAEEARYLLNRGIEVEVVPGITSAIAGPESFGIPLTVKNRLQSLAILTGRKKDKNAAIDAPKSDTLVYLMAVNNIANVVNALRKSGKDPNTPCAFIEHATCENSRLIKATIGTISKAVRAQNVKAPAVFIVGKVVNYYKDGYENSKKKK